MQLVHEFVVSNAACADFYEIAAFGSERYGPAAASLYVDSFSDTFDLLCRHPSIGRAREELADGLRSRRHASHIIYYVVQQGTVTIVRVIHAAADVSRSFRA